MRTPAAVARISSRTHLPLATRTTDIAMLSERPLTWTRKAAMGREYQLDTGERTVGRPTWLNDCNAA